MHMSVRNASWCILTMYKTVQLFFLVLAIYKAPSYQVINRIDTTANIVN
jgi:hypothetical protein